MNILFTCAGRRNYLINFFREALGSNGKLFAIDSNPYASALQEADKAFILPPINNGKYLDKLLEICQKYQVRILISLNDLDLAELSPFILTKLLSFLFIPK